MILDTNFIIDLMNKEDSASKKLDVLLKNQEKLAVTSVTVFELFSGLAQAEKKTEEKIKIMNILKSINSITLDDDCAKMGGQVDGSLIKKGATIGPLDSMIAGIALVRNESLLTRNVKHFSRIDNLKVESY